MTHKVKILKKTQLTHDVIQFKLEKPNGFSYTEGQAIEASLDKQEFKDEWHPFTFTSLKNESFLELTIKIYKQDEGLTLALSKLKEGEELLITDPFDTFHNKGAAVFIAGGTGITPFIALLRRLYVDGEINGSKLFFANKTEKDIFLYDEFSKMLGQNFVNILSREHKEPYLYGRINIDFLEKHFDNFNMPFYICGPKGFAEDISKHLKELGAGDDLVNISL
jgi:hypothetical protein